MQKSARAELGLQLHDALGGGGAQGYKLKANFESSHHNIVSSVESKCGVKWATLGSSGVQPAPPHLGGVLDTLRGAWRCRESQT